VLKRLNETANLAEGDVVFADLEQIIAIAIKPSEVIVIHPKDSYEMAAACYEIGNKHLPLFYEDGALLVPFEKPIFHMLQAAGFDAVHSTEKLLLPLKTSVRPHGHQESESLFSRILKLTTNNG
jgi:urease accessory protein